MKQLLSIRLQNFQSHLDTTIEFSDGVNAIAGLSRKGKSAIFRAFKWVFENDPSSNPFASWWGGVTRVTVNFEDGSVIREMGKGSGAGKYFLNLPGQKEKSFEGFGQHNVPEPVKDFLQIYDFNIRYQHQAPFLISDKPGDRSKYLNKIAHLDSIDRAISNIASVLKIENDNKKLEEKTAERLTEELKEYDFLPIAERKLNRLEKEQEEITQASRRYNDLLGFIESIETIQKDLLFVTNLVAFKPRIDKLVLQERLLGELREKSNKLYFYVDEISKNQEDLNRVRKVINFRKQISSLLTVEKEIGDVTLQANRLEAAISEIKTLENDVNRVSEVLNFRNRIVKAEKTENEIKNIRIKKSKLLLYINDIKELSLKCKQTESYRLQIQQEFDTEMPDVCPLCGSINN